jgi:hypothetical protein
MAMALVNAHLDSCVGAPARSHTNAVVSLADDDDTDKHTDATTTTTTTVGDTVDAGARSHAGVDWRAPVHAMRDVPKNVNYTSMQTAAIKKRAQSFGINSAGKREVLCVCVCM